ncbi:hypothetical protein FA048_17790 [Pedobacter polaris]|uniref:DUF4251 domain-containing protein n=1 Tax=Pedobacter polaris TaxID=2571273 RepID=A0A4U1CGP5_9SPHI|nr:hypothetical protein [Pedobacter polaris]TKC05575.1 hypothetical protein FA048_17790 [Pedobacter polaris]
MKKFTLNLKIVFSFTACIAFCVFSGFDLPEENTVIIQNILTKYYDNDSQIKDIKRFEINVTNTGFCRYRKVFNNGKQEYFAFNLARLKSMDYYGTTTKGELYLRTKNDDVIVQTRNDRAGDIDSMGTYMVIPLKNIEVSELNALAENFKKMNATLLVHK